MKRPLNTIGKYGSSRNLGAS